VDEDVDERVRRLCTEGAARGACRRPELRDELRGRELRGAPAGRVADHLVDVAAGAQHAEHRGRLRQAGDQRQVGDDVADRPVRAERLGVPVGGREPVEQVGEVAPLGLDRAQDGVPVHDGLLGAGRCRPGP
jgi:hypothetical protein